MSDRLPSPAAVKAPKTRLHPSSSSLRLHLPARSVAVGERVILESDFDGRYRAVCLDCLWDGNWGDGIEAGEDQADHEIYGCRRRYLRDLLPAARAARAADSVVTSHSSMVEAHHQLPPQTDVG